jgi:TonB-linked SusC/RagA family outer membrane protein
MKKFLLIIAGICLFSTASLAQNKSVRGAVLDETGLPIPGAFVLQQGTGNGVMTDIDGNYEIKVPEGAVLVVSCMGYLEQQVSVGKADKYDFRLEVDALLMEEAVVVGYGTQKAKDLTAPIVNVKGDELNKQISGSAISALQGKASGVRIIQSGAPGAAPAVTIRGTGSIGSYATPLYVVDGVFVDNISFISTSDIEEMTVLKDASAAAIYGVRAANGVILITTKKGRMNHTDISYDGYAGLQVPVNVMKLANRDQYVEILNEAFSSDASYVPKNASDYPASTDWYAALLRNALTHSHSLDVSGATEKTNYSFGLNYYYQDGIMNVDNNYERVNFRGRIDQRVKDWLTLGMNALVSDYKRKDPNSGAFAQAFVNPPVYPIYNDANTDAYPVKFDSPQRYGFGGSYGNPFAAIYYADNSTKGLNLVFSTYAEVKMLQDKLNFRTAYNLDYQGYKSESYTTEHMVYGTQGVGISSMRKTYGLRRKQIIDNTLTYADSKGKHSFSAMLGQSTRIEKLHGLTGSATDIPDIDAQSRYIGLGSAKDIAVSDLNPGPYTYHGLSFFSRGTWNYNDTYLATLTFRADASSKYQEKWGFFPSIGLGWVLSEEGFMKSAPAFEYLKLRASWGLLGNDNVPANSASIVGKSGYSASAVWNGVLVDGVGAQTVYQNYLK